MDPVVLEHLKKNNEAAEKHIKLTRHNQELIKQSSIASSKRLPKADQSFLWLDKELLHNQKP